MTRGSSSAHTATCERGSSSSWAVPPSARRTAKLWTRRGGTDCVTEEAGTPGPLRGDTVLAIVDVGEHRPFVVWRRPDSGIPASIREILGNNAYSVGGGNTGYQIAEELSATHEVHLSIGSRQIPLPQRVLGRDLFQVLESIGAMRNRRLAAWPAAQGPRHTHRLEPAQSASASIRIHARPPKPLKEPTDAAAQIATPATTLTDGRLPLVGARRCGSRKRPDVACRSPAPEPVAPLSFGRERRGSADHEPAQRGKEYLVDRQETDPKKFWSRSIARRAFRAKGV
jgi:hypothetical protein